MIRGVIFDLGNTLLEFTGEWDPTITRGTREMCAYLNGRGYSVPPALADDFRALHDAGRQRVLTTDIEYTTEQALNQALTRHNICWIPHAVLPHAVEKFYDAEAAQWRAYADTLATLEILRDRGLKLALLSNATDHAFVERLSRNAAIADFFDPLLSSAKISHRKPDPRAFQPILDAWQIPASETVMVGDQPSFDILGAHRAGMRGILIEERWETPRQPHAQFADAHLLEPDAVVRQLSELPAMIDTMNRGEIDS